MNNSNAIDFDINRRAEKLDLSIIQQFLNSLGYNIIALEQQWRHVTGIVEKNQQKQFFKMSSSPEISRTTRNEYAWNQLLSSHPQIFVPQNYDSGIYNNLFWFTYEYIDGQSLTESSDYELVKKYPAIIELALSIMRLDQNTQLPYDITLKNENGKLSKTDVMLQKAQYWMAHFGYDVNKLYYQLENNIMVLETAPQHGDFISRHIIVKNNQLFLIDGEHAQLNGFKYHDIAYFFYRTYTVLKRPDLAGFFIKNFLNAVRHDFTDKDREIVKTLLSFRTIGGFYDSNDDNNFDVSLNFKFQEQLLNDELF